MQSFLEHKLIILSSDSVLLRKYFNLFFLPNKKHCSSAIVKDKVFKAKLLTKVIFIYSWLSSIGSKLMPK